MSFTRKIIDGVNSVMDRVAADDTPLSHVEEISLERELTLRAAAREANPRKPRDNPRARLAGAAAESRAEREQRADKRAAKVHAAREKRERAAKQAQEESFRKAREQAERAARDSTRQYRRSSGARNAGAGRRSSGRRRTGRSPFHGGGDKIAEYYKVLDLPVGAPFEDVKKSYRKLMRKYHPDRHVGNPKKQKAATELSMRVTQAYKELEDHLKGK